MVAVPLPAPKRLFSPSTAPDDGIVLISCTMVGAPRFSSSRALTTSTGRAESLGVPAMKDPVTITSSTLVTAAAAASAVVADLAGCAAACWENPIARTTATIEPPQK